MKDTTGGEIVQVQGGHIIRSTGRKDRHSKVYTSKGPRDRRVRLAAHTAIQFYDVQDRLGYDRPSKAVDWLMSKAKNAIDKLYHEVEPTPLYSNNPSSNEDPSQTGYEPIQSGTNNTLYMDPDPHFVSTIKSFFPTSSLNLPDDFSSEEQHRSGTSSFDLGLSLHTLQAHENHSNMNTFQENFQWSGNGNGNGENHNDMGSDRVGFMMNSHEMAQDAVFTQGFPFTHRELLQSNSVVDAWNHERQLGYSESARNSSNFGSFFELGFSVPPRIYGEDEPNTHN